MYTIVNVPFVKEGYLELYVFGDKHYGIGNDQDRTLIQKVIAEIMAKNDAAIRAGKSPYCFAVGVGDTLDLSIKGKFGEIGKHDSVKVAKKNFLADFLPLMLKGYYLGDVPGNHDVRISNAIGSHYDIVEEIIEDANEQHGLSMGYGCPHMILDMKLGTDKKDKYSRFIGFITHGAGGGGTIGTVANQTLKSLNELSDFDFSIQGHLHRDLHFPQYRPYYDRVNKTVNTQLQHFFAVSSTQKKDGYAAVARLANGGTSARVIKFYAADKDNCKRVEAGPILFGDNGVLKSKKVGFEDNA